MPISSLRCSLQDSKDVPAIKRVYTEPIDPVGATEINEQFLSPYFLNSSRSHSSNKPS